MTRRDHLFYGTSEHVHLWSEPVLTDRGLLRESTCTECKIVQITVGNFGSLSCSWHGEQMSSPCYSCESVPWRHGMVWRDQPDVKVARCDFVDRNGHGDTMRCYLISGHHIGHAMSCPSMNPAGPLLTCWLPYGHPGDNHVDRSGEHAWVDRWIGPMSRKPESAWKAIPL